MSVQASVFESHEAIIANCRSHPGMLELIMKRAEEIQHETHAVEMKSLEVRRIAMVSKRAAEAAEHVKHMTRLQAPLTLREKARAILRGVTSLFDWMD